MTHKYVGTIYFEADNDTDVSQALVLGAERMEQFANDIKIHDTKVEDYVETPTPNE